MQLRLIPRHQFTAIYFLFALLVMFFSCINYSQAALGQSQNLTNNTNIQDGSSRGRPTRRRGTGSRDGECPVVKIPLTALVASKGSSLVIEEHPTFWFFVPYQSNQAALGEFSLQDEANKDIYRTNFQVAEKPGIVSVSLPSNITPLKINNTYRWHLKIYCDNRTNQVSQKISDFVFGSVQRVALKSDLERQLQLLNVPRKRIDFYIKNNIWQSALSDLGKVYFTPTQNNTFRQEWANLLKDMSLEDLLQQPILGEVDKF
jgi:Domain of Unknown Function (DUF928)